MPLALHEFLMLRTQLPLADVRSESEFAEGHMHHAVNLPILNDAERVAVGTDYKQKGQQEAIKTGFRLVGPRLEKLVAEAQQAAAGGELLVHCWRGGMRSGNFCQFVGMAGVRTHQLEGGYKAYRQMAVEYFALPLKLLVLGGKTGSGKTEILQTLKQQGAQVLDLEALAHHKGSAFGGLMQAPQPTTEQFQNELFETLLSLDVTQPIWVEDESIAIGKNYLPEPFWRTLRNSPLFKVEVDKDIRVKRLVQEYAPAKPEEFLAAMQKITKRLGGQHYLAAREKWLAGEYEASIDILLTYYDKAYSNGMEGRNIQGGHFAWDGLEPVGIAKELLKATAV